ncbi:NADP-dependent oxidoreductase domain-containing protein [Microdochium trichocladiopsis]|uniref:NADP-dependent oxidoreductase domain-containing protein n=1 Tax=Microdochium trichocladiopsis TaxID=1682393 RepID=A0A9P9BPL2_9PEZI|nr:NADP-dependent oxidoreductase domain-containing protein [Microdochium trichocladiopsis]KAH7024671.1 NADP-dependent oxidoreductase domain-containing protein [Microdochium trichocladiopsis]
MPSIPTSLVGKPIGPTSLGLMGMSGIHDMPFDEANKVLEAALELGANFWNGGIFYGTPERNSLHLLAHYFKTHPADIPKVVISIKGAYDRFTHIPDGTPEGVRAQVDLALSVLAPAGITTLDIFECARVDPKTPIETTVGAFAELIKEGKIRGYGLSEVSPATVRRACAVLKPAAVEVEVSMFSRETLEKGGVVDVCHELGVPVVGYGPLGKGWLTGTLKTLDDLPADDVRRHFPRFQPGAFEKNVELANKIESLAKRKGVPVAAVAVAWVRQVAGAVPLPGASSVARVKENMTVAELTDDEIKEIQGYLDTAEVAGHRYPPVFQGLLSG